MHGLIGATPDHIGQVSDSLPKLPTRIEFCVPRQVRSGCSRGVISPDVREKLKLMGLIRETGSGLVITDEGLRRIEAAR
jgi:hypothetical protein